MTYSMHYVKKEYDALLYVKLKRNIWDSTKYLHNLYPLYLYLRAHIITNNFGHRVHASVLGPLNFVILPSFQSLYSTKTMELCIHWLWIGILHDHSFVAKKIIYDLINCNLCTVPVESSLSLFNWHIFALCPHCSVIFLCSELF